MAYFPPTGSVVAFQSDPTKLQVTASVSGTLNINPASISGQVGASIIGLPPVNVTNFPTTQNVSGSVAAWLQSTNASIITVGGAAGTQYLENAQVPSVTGNAIMFRSNHSSSIMSVVDPVTPLPIVGSVSGSVGITGIVNTSGSVAAIITNAPSVYGNISGSVVAYQGVGWSGSVAAFVSGLQGHSVSGTVQVGNFPTTQNISGSVVAFGTVGASIIGLTPVSISNFPTNQNISGSVVAFGTIGASVIGLTPIQVPGSVAVAIVSGSIAVSITPPANQSVSGTVNIGTGGPVSVVGTLSVLGTVPVTQSTSPWVVGSVVTTTSGTPFRYTGSLVSGSVTLIAASVAAKQHYITDFKFANIGSVSTLITFQDGSTSIVGYTIAPAGGGSNYPGALVPDRANLAQDLTFKMTTMTSVLYATISGYTL